MNHGTRTCYVYYKCRCEACTEANAEDCARMARKRDPSELPPEKHGRVSTYSNWGCRCDECRLAMKVYNGRRGTQKRQPSASADADA